MARTDTLSNFLTDVADAIREKKGTSETITASNFDTEIENLPSGADLSEYFNQEITTNSSASVQPMITKKIPTLTIGENVTSLAYAFGTINAEEFMGFKNFTNKIALMQSCFQNSAFSIINVKGIDTSGVTNMSSCFQSCKNATSLDLSDWDTSSVTTMNSMFRANPNLQYLDIRNFTFNDGVDASWAFYNVPRNCEIIVKSQTEKDFILNTTGGAGLTNVKTVAEYEAE